MICEPDQEIKEPIIKSLANESPLFQMNRVFSNDQDMPNLNNRFSGSLKNLVTIKFCNTSHMIETIPQLRGLFKENPLLIRSFFLCLFSLRGIPPLIGFFGKYAILSSLIQHGYLWLALVRILTSVLSAAYYLRMRSVFFDIPFKERNKESVIFYT